MSSSRTAVPFAQAAHSGLTVVPVGMPKTEAPPARLAWPSAMPRAEATGRRLCVAGRSLDRIIRAAQSTGYLLDLPELVDFTEAMRLPRGEVLILATGGQGEPRAALARVAAHQHQKRRLVDESTHKVQGQGLIVNGNAFERGHR